MPFDLDGARKSGYSDTEISDFLATQHKFDIAGARSAGYNDTELVDFLSKAEPKKTTLKKVGEFVGDVATGIATAPIVLGEQLAGVDALVSKVSPRAQLEKAINPGAADLRIAERQKFLQKAGELKQGIYDTTLSDEAKAQQAEQSAISKDPNLGMVEGTAVQAGRALTTPRTTLREVVENLPSLLLGGGLMRAVSGAGKAATAAAGYGTTGAIEGGGAYSQTLSEGAQKLGAVDDDQLAQQFPSYADDLRNNVPREQALLRLADRAATTAGGITALVAPLIDKALGGQKLDTAAFTKQIAKESLPKAVTRELAAETLQGGTGQVAQNIGTRAYVDPTQSLTEGVGQAAGGEGVAGLVTGSGMHLLSGNKPKADPIAAIGAASSVDGAIAAATAAVDAPIDAAEFLGKVEPQLVAAAPAPAPTPAPPAQPIPTAPAPLALPSPDSPIPGDPTLIAAAEGLRPRTYRDAQATDQAIEAARAVAEQRTELGTAPLRIPTEAINEAPRNAAAPTPVSASGTSAEAGIADPAPGRVSGAPTENAAPAPRTPTPQGTADVVTSSGKPFATEKSASVAIQGRKLRGYTPVPVEGGWVARKAAPVAESATNVAQPATSAPTPAAASPVVTPPIQPQTSAAAAPTPVSAVPSTPENAEIAKMESDVAENAEPNLRTDGPMFSRQSDNIEQYALKTQQTKSGLPVLYNNHIGLVKPRLISEKAGLQKIAFEIRDTSDVASLKHVGEVILGMRDGKVVSLHNIQVNPSVRQKGKGYGEDVVASLVQSFPQLDVIDIQHAGQEPEFDALPFWRKMGVSLKNFSSDPNVEMDGSITKDSYVASRDTGKSKAPRGDAQEDRQSDTGRTESPGRGAGGIQGNVGTRRAAEPAEVTKPAQIEKTPSDEGVSTSERDSLFRRISFPQDIKGAQPKKDGVSEAAFRSKLSEAFGAKPAQRLIESGIVTPLATQEDIPAHLKRDIRPGDVILGIYDPKTDKTYAVLENLKPESVRSLVMHEVGTHFGFKRMLGEQRYAEVMRQLDNLAKIDKRVKEARAIAERESVNEKQVPEETLAYLVQNHPQLSIVEKVVSAVKAFMFKQFGMGSLTANDLSTLAAAAVRHAADVPHLIDATSLTAPPALASRNAIKQPSPAPETRTEGKDAKFARADTAAEEAKDKSSASGPLDSLLATMGGRAIAKHITMPLYRRLLGLGQFLPEKIKAGLVSDYGLPEPYVDERNASLAAQITQARNAASTIEKLGALTRAQSAVAYQWMTQNDARGDDLLKQLPSPQQSVLREIKALITEMGKEAVELGQLSKESFEKNKDAYLHRSYRKFELDATKQDGVARASAIKVMGQQYRGRGLKDDVPIEQVGSATEKGEKFIRYERRDADGALRKIAYIPAGKPLNETQAERYADWQSDGVWEARWIGEKSIGMWRDFTQPELQRMGQLDEVRFAVAKTLHQMVRDIEIGRFFKWVDAEYAKDSDAGLDVVETPTGRGLSTFSSDEWVQVPETKIPGTETRAYGAIAGKYIPAPMWNDLRQMSSAKFQPFGDLYADALKYWKLSKTALSPATHMNNVMSNILLADMHDVSVKDIYKSLRTLLGKTEESKAMVERFKASGAELGGYILTETQRETIEPLLEELRQEIAKADGEGAIGRAASIVNLVAHREFREALNKASSSKAFMLSKKAASIMINAYQTEDTVFRLAAFLKHVDEGKSDKQAGKLARESFLDYSINAPWVANLRATFWPFAAFPYRAAPMLLKNVAEKPWKMAKYMAIAGALNKAAFLALGLTGEDEDKERALLPDEKSGKIWGVFPRLMRMPWNDANSNPVYLDIRRWIPVGDILDTEQNHAAIPLPQTLMPGGPLMIVGEIIANKSGFTGQPITLETDTPAEQAGKVFDYLYKSIVPNIPMLPGSHSWDKVMDAGGGKTDAFGREYSLPQAALSSVGIKVASYPQDVLMKNLEGKLRLQEMEIDMAFSKVKRELERHGITEEDFVKKQDAMIEKKQKLREEFQRKIGAL